MLGIRPAGGGAHSYYEDDRNVENYGEPCPLGRLGRRRHRERDRRRRAQRENPSPSHCCSPFVESASSKAHAPETPVHARRQSLLTSEHSLVHQLARGASTMAR